MESYEQWQNRGEAFQVDTGLGVFNIFTIVINQNQEKPWLTLLHGFPTSSWDYHKILPSLEEHFNILIFDFLGFGLSDKPRFHSYSIHEQANICEYLWKKLNIQKTFMIAHDYGATVLQELIARKNESHKNSIEFDKIVLMNSGLVPSLHKPILVQKLLNNKLLGPLVSLLVTKKSLHKNLKSIFSSHHPPSEKEMDTLWKFIQTHNGNLKYHKLIHYLDDRKNNSNRWVQSLEAKEDMYYLWGPEDPVSGQHMLARVKEIAPHSTFHTSPNVGHYPQFEAPNEIIKLLKSINFR
jgi:pimeloyl-ACP methyl ester carboxylesterase